MSVKDLSLTFYFPYREVSGVPVLFSRLVNHIAEHNKNVKLFVIDYIDGAIAVNLINNNSISLIPFEDGKRVEVPQNSTLILQAILPYSIRPELVIPEETKIIFWCLHPDNLVPILFPIPYVRNLQNKSFIFYKIISKLLFHNTLKRLSSFVNLCIEKKAIWFMDQSNFDKLSKYLFIDLPSVDFVPVPAVKAFEWQRKEIALGTKENLNICWIGRLCDFKSHILIYTIQRLSEIAKEMKIPIQYYVIGKGPFEEKIKQLIVNNDYFEIIVKGAMNPVELDEFILSDIDVISAMGTSALEGAKFGSPVILLDISYYPIKGDYLFRWLHDTINFDLGHDITHKDIQTSNNSLKQMLNDLLYNYKQLSDLSYSYFIKNHDIEIVSNLVIKNATESNFCFLDIDKRLLHKSLLRRMYDKSRSYLNLNMYR